MLLLSSVSQARPITFHGWINPLKYLKGEALDTVYTFPVQDGDTMEDLQYLLPRFVHALGGMNRHLAVNGRQRIGSAPCDTSIDTQNILPHWERLRKHGVPLSHKIVNIGASDGKSEDPLYDLVTQEGLTGVAVEPATDKCLAFQRHLSNITLQCTSATPQILPGLILEHVGPAVDVVKVDIDSYDCAILEELLSRLTTHLLLMEVNPGIPPPFKWAMRYHADLSAFLGNLDAEELQSAPIRGCSLSYVVSLAKKYGYDFVAFGHHDALFSHRSLRHVWDWQPPMDEVRCYNESFVSLNGIPIELARQWFFEGDLSSNIVSIWEFFIDWMRNHAGGKLFPFTLDA